MRDNPLKPPIRLQPGIVFQISISLLCCLSTRAQTITTFAGTDWFFPASSLPARNAPLGYLQGMTIDSQGNLYVGDGSNAMLMRITPDGVLTVVAGNGQKGVGGFAGRATSVPLLSPCGVTTDAAGSIYIADVSSVVRKVSPDGNIVVVAGNVNLGVGYSGDGGSALQAQLGGVSGVAMDGSGSLYISDSSNHRIRKVTPDGLIHTVAGNGTQGASGDGGPGTQAQLYAPTGIAVDRLGNLFIVDRGNSRIRKLAPNGVITTVAGTGSYGFCGDGGQATSACLYLPNGVSVDGSGNLFIADTSNNRV